MAEPSPRAWPHCVGLSPVPHHTAVSGPGRAGALTRPTRCGTGFLGFRFFVSAGYGQALVTPPLRGSSVQPCLPSVARSWPVAGASARRHADRPAAAPARSRRSRRDVAESRDCRRRPLRPRQRARSRRDLGGAGEAAAVPVGRHGGCCIGRCEQPDNAGGVVLDARTAGTAPTASRSSAVSGSWRPRGTRTTSTASLAGWEATPEQQMTIARDIFAQYGPGVVGRARAPPARPSDSIDATSIVPAQLGIGESSVGEMSR